MDTINNLIINLTFQEYGSNNSKLLALNDRYDRIAALLLNSAGKLELEIEKNKTRTKIALPDEISIPTHQDDRNSFKVLSLPNGSTLVALVLWPERYKANQTYYLLFDENGGLIGQPKLDYYITKLAVIDNLIAASFSEEVIFSSSNPGKDGIALFNLDGSYVKGYHSFFGDEAAQISDCFWFSQYKNQLLFEAETDDSSFMHMNLIVWDIKSGKQDIILLKEGCSFTEYWGRIDNYLLNIPINQDSYIFCRELSNDEVIKLGKLPAELINLPLVDCYDATFKFLSDNGMYTLSICKKE